MDKNITIPKKEIAPGTYTTGGTATTPSNVITPASLQQQPPIQLPQTQTDTTNFGGVIGGVGESIANDLNFLTGKVDAQEQNLAQGQNDISTLLRGISQEGNELLAEQDRQGVNKETEKFNTLQQTLLDLQGQATSLNREAQAIPLQVQAENKNQLATSQRTDVIGTERLRDNALRALSIAQQSDIAFAAATGSQIRLQAAKDKANQIVEMKFAPLKAELEIRKQQYEFNKDILERFDKKRSEALGIALKREETELAKREENEKAISKMIIDATPNAPADIISSAKAIKDNGGSALEVAQALGKYGGDYLKTEMLKEQIKTEKAQQANIYNTISARNADTARQNAESLLNGGGKPPTAAQSTAAGYASRVVQSKDLIDTNTEKLSKLNTASYLAQRKLPNYLQSPLVQQQLQAERNFVNAVLRRESGAAIADSEFESATKQYFPMPGDSKEVLAQKKANRDLTSQNLINESGSAYTSSPVDEYFNFATGSIQTVNNKINNKEDAFLMSLPK